MTPGKSLFAASCDALLAGRQPWRPSGPSADSAGAGTSTDPTDAGSSAPSDCQAAEHRYFADLLCLPVEAAALRGALSTDTLANQVLLDETPASKGERIRHNVRKLWSHALEAYAVRDENRWSNALQILHILSDGLLSRRLSSLSIMTIICSSVTKADADLVKLVEAIRASLQRCAGSIAAQPMDTDKVKGRSQTDEDGHRGELQATLRLIIVWMVHIGQSTLACIFFQRDLFPALSDVLAVLSARPLQDEGIAASLNLAGVALALLSTAELRSSSGGSAARSPHSRLTELDWESVLLPSNPYALRISDWVDLPAMSGLAAHPATSPSGISRLWSGFFSQPASAGDTAKDGRLNADLPPPEISALLTYLVLLNINGAFAGVLTQDQDPEQPPSPLLGFLCLSTFMHTHATQDTRTESIARASLALLFSIVQHAAAEKLLRPLDAKELAGLQVQLERQASTPANASAIIFTSLSSGSQSLSTRGKQQAQTSAHFILLSCLAFLRNNLSKRFNGEGYITALRALSGLIDLVASTRSMLEFDWVALWRSVLSLANFLASRLSELDGKLQPSARLAGKQLLATLCAALLESDHFLPTPRDARELIYEIVRSADALRRLAAALVPHLMPSVASAASQNDAGAETSQNARSVAPLPSVAYVELPGWRVLELLLKTVETKISERQAAGAPASAQQSKAPPLDIEAIRGIIASLELDVLLAGASIEEVQLGRTRRSAQQPSSSFARADGRALGARDSGNGARGRYLLDLDRSASSSAATSRSASPAPTGGAYISERGANSAQGSLLEVVRVCGTYALEL